MGLCFTTLILWYEKYKSATMTFKLHVLDNKTSSFSLEMLGISAYWPGKPVLDFGTKQVPRT